MKDCIHMLLYNLLLPDIVQSSCLLHHWAFYPKALGRRRVHSIITSAALPLLSGQQPVPGLPAVAPSWPSSFRPSRPRSGRSEASQLLPQPVLAGLDLLQWTLLLQITLQT